MNLIKYLVVFSLTNCILYACTTRVDFVQKKHVATLETDIVIYYNLYKTGIDNYSYKFALKHNNDTVSLFNAYLNDATYKNVEFQTRYENDTLFVYSNWNLGKHIYKHEERVILLEYRPLK
ncbi:MAG TPA: hypothetical protein DDX98_10685 [Bacteroidales bacterium]|nr:hypothetical protein [Bacteroidales bacterium]